MIGRITGFKEIFPIVLDQDYNPPLRGIVIGTAGTINVTCPGKSPVTTNILPAGVYPGDIVRIATSGTSAAQISGYR